MPNLRAAALVVVACAAVLSAACGAATSTPSARVTTTTHTSTTPAASAAADNQTVSVVTTGVGAWQLVAIPVAMLKNNAAHHGAAAVVVHFVTHGPGGGTLGSLDSEAVNLAPGETLPVAADCTDGCNGATTTDVKVDVGSWTTSSGPFFTAVAGTFQCGTGSCNGGGHGQGTVSGQLTVSRLAQDVSIVEFAVCTDAAGTIMGAGTTQTIWPGGGTSAAHVPVIVNNAPAACQLSASAGW
ncbi:MAG: hypothetical protein ACREN2_04485 [Candidatus Dormibacteria bacterium]